MKKNMKILKIVPLMLVIVFMLTGCVSLQSLKDEPAIWTDSTKKTLIWKENEYLYLTNEESSNLYIDINANTTLNVTKSDVPTLLKFRLGDFAVVSKDEQFVSVYTDIYCIKNKYEEMQKRLEEENNLNLCASQYYNWGGEGEDFSSTLLHIFTDEEEKLLEEIDKNSVQKKNYEDWEEHVFISDLFFVSEDGVFREYRDIGLYRTKDGEFFWEKFVEGEYATYAIPEECNESVESLFADEIKKAEEGEEYTVNYDEEYTSY